jgi:hypothetical protein
MGGDEHMVRANCSRQQIPHRIPACLVVEPSPTCCPQQGALPPATYMVVSY